MKHDQKLFA